MKWLKRVIVAGVFCPTLINCEDSAEHADRQAVDRQQRHYSKSQPVPWYDHSLERDVVIQLYDARNEQVTTFTVWRSNTGRIEGHCPSIGYPIPYDTSLTNPKQPAYSHNHGTVAIGQAEPNGLFASRNSTATWVRCITKVNGEAVEAPIYIESKVTAYPFPVNVDYEKNMVVPVANVMPSVQIKKRRNVKPAPRPLKKVP